MTSPDRVVELERRRTIGKIAGALYIFGALLSVPSALLVTPAPPPIVYLLIALGFVSGVFFLLFPWERTSSRWLHVIAILGMIEITLGIRATGIHGSLYSWLYMLIAIGVAYAFSSRRTIALYMLAITAAMTTQLIGTPLSTTDVLRNIAVSVPSLVMACGVIVFFRERLEEGQRAYLRLARLDPLTGVGNYRTLHEMLNYEIARHDRHGRTFAVLLIDLDNFKQINETHGHLEGDRLLKQVGGALRGEMRDEDTVARQGGDEFSVLVPEAGRDDAMMLEERLHEALSKVIVGDQPLTAVVGWAVYPGDGTTPETLLARADAELFGGKREQPRRLATVHQLRPS